MARFFEIASIQTLNLAPYGYVYDWDVERYRKQMSFENLKTHQSPNRFQFNGLNDALTVITQSTAQDCWWYAQDVHELRTVKLPFLFVKDGDKPAAETDRFWAITRLSHKFLKRFTRSADNLTLPWTELGIAFRETPAPDTYQDDGEPDRDDLCSSARVWPVQVESFERKRRDRATNNGGYFLLEVHRPRDPTSPAYRIRDHQVQAFPRLEKYEDEKKDIVNMLSKFGKDKREEIYLSFHDERVLSRRRVNATNDLFNATKLARDSLPDHDIGTESGFSEDYRRVILQEFFIGRGYCHPVSEWHKFVSGGSDHFDAEYADMAISQLSSVSRDRFRQYIELVSLGLVGICGRWGVGEALAVTTLLFLANTGTNKVHASSSTHNVVHVYANNLHEMSKKVVEALIEGTGPDSPRHIPLVVRGYNIKKEVGSFIRLIVKGNIEWEMSKWSQELSPCEWLLKLANFDKFDLHPLDSPKPFQIRQGFRHNRQYAGLRAFVAGDIPLRNVKDFTAAGAVSSGSDNAYRNMTAQEQRDSRLRAEHWARELIKSLLEKIIESADVVCTTTHTSRDATYNTFRESAKATVLADAGSMLKAEAIVVWGPSFKPCAIGGDVGRKTRPFIDPSHMQGDKYSNHFRPEARISVLRHMMGSGNAIFMH
ncbi:hypothetical protein LZ31DRAFT_592298 [Colletotrichum somersetense]|nr:hypothetical protein LZ31DRAFT_592298 [Colletotrichum somersetense]